MYLEFLTYVWISGIISAVVAHPSDRAERKGSPPPCNVSPGQTYCENVNNYPYEMVLNALRNSNRDISHLLISESMDDGPNIRNDRTAAESAGRRGLINQTSTLLELEMPKWDFVGDESIPDNFLENEGVQNLTVNRPDVLYEKNIMRLNGISRNAMTNNSRRLSPISWLRDREERQDVDSLEPGPPFCRSMSKYLCPRATMSVTTGEYMYVVNARYIDNRITCQLMVKPEVCKCSGYQLLT